MKRILIVYKVFTEVTPEYISQLLHGCRSRKHSVTVSFHDFTEAKQLYNIISELPVIDDVYKIEYHSENISDATNNSDAVINQKSIKYIGCDVMSIIAQDVQIIDYILDDIDFTVLEEGNTKSMYFDNSIQKPFKTRMYNKSHPLMKSGLRCVFCAMSAMTELIGNTNPIGYIYTAYPSVHVSKNVLIINNT